VTKTNPKFLMYFPLRGWGDSRTHIPWRVLGAASPYLISYFAFFYVTITTILFKADFKRALILYKNNLVYKVLFWPLMLTGVFIISLMTFY
jgi:hypothetical protein